MQQAPDVHRRGVWIPRLLWELLSIEMGSDVEQAAQRVVRMCLVRETLGNP